MDLSLRILLTCAIAIVLGIILGNSAVYVFNRIPGKWLTDYDEEPSEELLHPTVQRVKSVPYKYAFTGLFIAAGIITGIKDPLTALPFLAALWLLLLMSIADIKYMVVPDQLMILLILTGLGFLPSRMAVYHRHAFYDSLLGMTSGLVIMLAIALFSRAIYKKWALGGADVKLLTVTGFLTGFYGVLIVFVLSTFMSALHFAFLVITKRAELKETRPLIPYISLAFAIYFIFIRAHIADFMITL